MDQETRRRQKQKRERERKRKLRRQYAMICRTLAAACAGLLVIWLLVGVTLSVRQKTVKRQTADISSAADRLQMYASQNAALEVQYQSLEHAIAQYENREENPGVVDEVYSMAELISKKERAATDRMQINESYAAAIEALKRQLQAMQP